MQRAHQLRRIPVSHFTPLFTNRTYTEQKKPCCHKIETKPVLIRAEKKSFWSDKALWKRAASNTFTCLIGCSIGDFGMLYILQTFYPAIAATMHIAMPLAMASGLTTSIILESTLLKIREKSWTWILCLRTAFNMSFLSMLAMELSENVTDVVLMRYLFNVNQFWSDNMYINAFTLAMSLFMGYITPLPYNYYMLKKHGKSCH
jgi:hypothetical protein